MPNLLLKREHSYYLNLRVPKKYAAHYPGSHLKENLKTLDKRKAQRLVAQRWAEIVEEWDRIDRTGSKARTTLTPEQTQELVIKAVQLRLLVDELFREQGVDASQDLRMRIWRALADKSERAFISSGQIDEGYAKIIEDWLSSNGFEIKAGSPEFRNFASEYIKAQTFASKAIAQRQEGELQETEDVLASLPKRRIPTSSSPAGIPLLSKVIDAFLEDYDSTKSMFSKYKVVLPLFLESVGDMPVSELKRRHINAYAELICKLPPHWTAIARKKRIKATQIAEMEHEKLISPKTFSGTYMAALRAFLGASQRNYGDEGFPANLTIQGVKYKGNRKAGERKQRAFTGQELKRLFEGPEMQAFALSPNEQHKYWLPLIGLYTGARVNEICQLNPQSDIREEESIWFFDFNEESETDTRVRRRLKTSTSTRKVPLHPALIHLGLPEYVKAVKATGSKLLFPLWNPYNAKASSAAEIWFRRFLAGAGLRDETAGKTITGMHAFRHTLINRALNLGVVNPEVITGHAGTKSSVIRGYEGQMELQNKLKILQQITFDIDPPKVRKATDTGA